MNKLAIAAIAAMFATSALAADLPVKRGQAQPDYPDYPPQARLTPPMPQPGFPQPGFPQMPFLGGPPPVNPCIAQAAVFPPPLPFLGLGIGRGFGGGHRR